MKTVLTIIAALGITATTFAQTGTEQETTIKLNSEERLQIQELKEAISNLSETLQVSLQEKDALGKNDITTLTELLESIHEEDRVQKEVILKIDDPSKRTAISYPFSINRDGKTETFEGFEKIDMSQLKEKLSKLSVSISESDDVKLLFEKLNEKALMIHQEIEEKKENRKH